MKKSLPPPLLVTGFSPFLGQTINPSALLLEELKKNQPAPVDTLLLPVSFQNVFPFFINHFLQQGPYRGILMLGQARGREAICLERVAVNWLESKHPDEDHFHPLPGKIDADGPDAFLNDFFQLQWISELSKQGPTISSFSAGTYVCNALYYQVFQYLQKKQLQIPAVFVHVPMIPEQIPATEKIPSLDLSIQNNIISELVRSWPGNY